MPAQPEPPHRPWFVYIQGETFGPLSEDIVVLMLRQNRLQFSDFIWGNGLAHAWVRISEVPQFSSMMPTYPNVPVPSAADAAVTSLEIPRVAQALRTAGLAKVAAPPEKPAPKKPKVRRHARVGMTAKFLTVDYGSFEVANISESGVYVRSTTVVPPLGTVLVFELTAVFFDQTLSMSGLVVRRGSANDPPGFAVEFTKVTKEQRKIIQDYVRENPDPTLVPPESGD